MSTPSLTGAVIATTRRRIAPVAPPVQNFPATRETIADFTTDGEKRSEAPTANSSLVPGLDRAIEALSGADDGSESSGELEKVASLISVAVKKCYLATRRGTQALLLTAYVSATAIKKLEPARQDAVLSLMLGKPPRAGNSIFLSVLQVIFDLPEANHGRLAIQKKLSAYGRTLERCAANGVRPEELINVLGQPGVGFAKPSHGIGATSDAGDDPELIEGSSVPPSSQLIDSRPAPPRYQKTRRDELAYAFTSDAEIEIDLGPMRSGVLPNTEVLALLEVSPDSAHAKVRACRILDTVGTPQDVAEAALRRVKIGRTAPSSGQTKSSDQPKFDADEAWEAAPVVQGQPV